MSIQELFKDEDSSTNTEDLYVTSKEEKEYLMLHLEFRILFVHRLQTDFIYYIPMTNASIDYKTNTRWIKNDENILTKLELFTTFVNAFQSFGILKVTTSKNVKSISGFLIPYFD